ncbi:uncharacterized protein [Chelonus insularis]|uniref:uncharacterized protein n=1 Tax=Chelonus insularis TaxID=460826 RepID=UPI00158AAC90|nr:uncharacterized protein LOC118070568 [Chelonus insularis]
MMDWIRFFMILLGVSISSKAFECPQGDGCGPCELYSADKYQIQCGLNNSDYTFNVELNIANYVSISCLTKTNWSKFHLGSKNPIKGIHSIAVSMCQLPEGNRFGTIVKKLLEEPVKSLTFSSYDNITSTLSRETLKGFENLTRLTLSSNSLTSIPGDLLHDLSNLTLLNLRQNNLHNLPVNFLNTPKLNTLELGSNKLEVIEAGIFDKLTNLTLLNIWNNNLKEIQPHAFDKLTSVQFIDLHINNLTNLPKDLFSANKKLKVLNLSQNNFSSESLPKDLLRNNFLLENFTMIQNKRNITTLPEGFFENLTGLMNLKLSKIGLLFIPENLFWGSTEIQTLHLDRNYLQTIPPNFFKDCSNLKSLILNFNELSDLPDNVFSTLKKLEVLDLSKNHITTISTNLLNGLSSLRVIKMERNGLMTIDPTAFQSLQNLRVAHFSHNSLTLKPKIMTYVDKYGSTSPFHLCQDTLEELYIDHNNITDVFFDWITSTHLRTLNLANNDLHFLETSDLQFLSNKIEVDMTNNKIQSIFLRHAEKLADVQRFPRNVFINIQNNPISCDCNLYDLLRYIEGDIHPYVQNLFSLKVDNLKCDQPASLKGIEISHLKSRSLTCEIIESPRDNLSCPQNCTCMKRPSDKSILIDCSYRGLTVAPEPLHVPAGRRVEMNLIGNHLTTMPSLTQSGYDQVTVLSLNKNSISQISANATSEKLESLYLDNNKLERIDNQVLELWKNSTKLTNLSLQYNPLICDCNAHNLVKFIQTMRIKIPELQDVTCVETDAFIFEMTPEELCPIILDWIIGLSIGVALIGMVIGLLIALSYRYQHEIKVWLYAHQSCMWFVTEEELDKDKLFDAFISFSQKDEEFVTKELVPKLEEGPKPFKLCVHYRDWKAGEFIPKQIARSIEDSRRTVVVLSPNFLESVWGRLEFRAAHRQALNEGRARVIVILYGDIGLTENLDPELKAYLNMNTYVRWGDPWFWEKLRYALPHATDVIKKKRNHEIKTIYETHFPTISLNTDKSELIQVNGIFPSAPSPPTSTPPADSIKTFINIESKQKLFMKWVAKMNWLLLTIIFQLAISRSYRTHCPKGGTCGPCELRSANKYKIICDLFESDTAFDVDFKLNEFVTITCLNDADLAEFELGSEKKLAEIDTIIISLCQLPDGKNLTTIAKTLLEEPVKSLTFSSYDNITSTLSRETLKGFENLTRLTLSSNSLTSIPGDLLHDLSNLTLLNLRQNNLHNLPVNFLNTPKLNTLELGSNKLEVIEAGIFDKLTNLTLLNIWNNNLKEIQPHAFDKLTSVQFIDLHINNLTNLPKDLFSANKKLKVLNLSQNNFSSESLPKDLLRNNFLLENFTMIQNKRNITTLPEGFFENLTGLMNLKLSKIGLLFIPENLFWGSTEIQTLHLDRNYLQTIPPNFFKDCSNLKSLILNFNELSDLPDNVFSTLKKLEVLDLSKNHITTISTKLLNRLSSLRAIKMEHNGLMTIDPKAFQNLNSLQFAHFSYNNLTLKSPVITNIDEHRLISPFHFCQDTLEELFIDHNNITEVFSDWTTAPRLRTLNLAYNQLYYLQISNLRFSSDMIEVDMTHNKIYTIYFQDIEASAEAQDISRKVIINVQNNPISCDCNLYDLLRYIEGKFHPNIRHLYNLKVDNLKCHRPERLKDVGIVYLKSRSLTCEIIESPRDNLSCPQNCTCMKRPSDKSILIDCSYRGLTVAPEPLHVPAGRRVEMNLIGNHLTTMPSLTQSGYDQVTVLSLNKNSISQISANATSEKLESLYLDNNKLERIDNQVLELWKNSTKLTNLSLQYNPLICDCNAHNLVKFIQTMRIKIPELQDVTCVETDAFIFEMTPEELCPIILDWIIGLSIGVALIGMVIGLLIALSYRYQHEIKVWLYAHQSCMWFVTEEELDKDKLFDAFISFSQKDEEFVTKELVPKLEEGPKPFKLCVHYRDWKAGEFIPKQIARSIEDSRRTVVVLSPNFLESVWGRLEFRAAHRQALNEGRARVIVILYGDIGLTENLDPELKAYLNMNTYVRWGDPWFWEKLRYALPHATDVIKKKRNHEIKTIYETHFPTISLNTDKSELIQVNGIFPSAPSPPTSTPPADSIKTFINIES